jgi:hypothetical protein
MKRKEIAPSGSGGVDSMMEWSIEENRTKKRCGIEDIMSSRDTSSDTSTYLGDEVCAP